MVADPDLYRIRIQLGQWILILIEECKNDPQKCKNKKIRFFVVLFYELKGSFVTFTSFMEA